MITASVSNLDLFRVWRESEDLSVEWLIERVQGRVEQTPQMKAGEAFHRALESLGTQGELCSLGEGDYRFDFNCDAEVQLTPFREQRVSRQYGELLVRGRVDAVHGLTIEDYKTTEQFDADRYMAGYQWRFYLDMTECERFRWKVFVMRFFGSGSHHDSATRQSYEIFQFHQLTQFRYPDLRRDCEKLAADYLEFAKQYLPEKAVA